MDDGAIGPLDDRDEETRFLGTRRYCHRSPVAICESKCSTQLDGKTAHLCWDDGDDERESIKFSIA
ncbi:MAG: hypothetical protein GDA43_02255 [Hormoscilla sp. SP5CHS1]|nr:hypothetical protein [Hormoscilla sp. SP12CHS1]MBC6452151.1 hypothetical protein [Hormoscilla sp. SP5CHS1]